MWLIFLKSWIKNIFFFKYNKLILLCKFYFNGVLNLLEVNKMVNVKLLVDFWCFIICFGCFKVELYVLEFFVFILYIDYLFVVFWLVGLEIFMNCIWL